MRDQLQARTALDKGRVDRCATPTGNEYFQVFEVRGDVLYAGKSATIDQIRGPLQALDVIVSKQLITHNRVHEHGGDWLFGHNRAKNNDY